jgi:predicted TIM-barrel fold metal-dependent hydrolase
MIIDMHHHFMPRKAYARFHDPDGPTTRKIMHGTDFVFYPKLHQVETHLADMDEAGIDMAFFGLAQWNVAGREICNIINYESAEEVARHPGRLLCAATVPVGDLQGSLDEIDYAINVLKLPAITLLSSMETITLSDKEFMWPIYEKAQSMNIPIIIHPNLLPANAESECTISRSIARGYDTAKCVLRFIYDVLPAFPDLKVVIPHYGGSTFAHKGRMNAFFEGDEETMNKIPQSIRVLPKSPAEVKEFGLDVQFNERFNKLYFDGAGSAGWEPITEMAFRVVNHDRLVFGTDYPMECHNGRDLKWYVDNVKAMDHISEESKNKFFGDNIVKLFNLK